MLTSKADGLRTALCDEDRVQKTDCPVYNSIRFRKQCKAKYFVWNDNKNNVVDLKNGYPLGTGYDCMWLSMKYSGTEGSSRCVTSDN
ncbi:UNVERIFIED_CONTAM: hypothetical protein FKN15_066460 [Acipenser sinensis]